MSRSLGGVVLAPRASVVLSVSDLSLALPPVCAVSGAAAEETITVPLFGRPAPLWLLFFGLTPYFVIRVLLRSGSSGKVALPVTRRVADFLALAQTAQLVGVVVALLSLVPGLLGWPFELVFLLPALLAVLWGSLVVHATAVRPTLIAGTVTMEVSQQLCEAIVSSRRAV